MSITRLTRLVLFTWMLLLNGIALMPGSALAQSRGAVRTYTPPPPPTYRPPPAPAYRPPAQTYRAPTFNQQAVGSPRNSGATWAAPRTPSPQFANRPSPAGSGWRAPANSNRTAGMAGVKPPVNTSPWLKPGTRSPSNGAAASIRGNNTSSLFRQPVANGNQRQFKAAQGSASFSGVHPDSKLAQHNKQLSSLFNARSAPQKGGGGGGGGGGDDGGDDGDPPPTLRPVPPMTFPDPGI